jgi:endonuclease-3
MAVTARPPKRSPASAAKAQTTRTTKKKPTAKKKAGGAAKARPRAAAPAKPKSSTRPKPAARPRDSARPKTAAKPRAAARPRAAAKTAPRAAGRAKPATSAPRFKETAAERALRVQAIIDGLEQLYPDAHCELDFRTPFELLIATILSAQSTDKLVNQVTPALFARYPDAQALAAAAVCEVERLVNSTGFFRNKARNAIACAQALMVDHGGEVPRSMEALIRLPGVARKTANVVLGSAYGLNEGIAVDTHVTRLAQRLALTRHSEPAKIEPDLCALFPREKWSHIGHQIIWHGRRVCDARRPACDRCTLAPHCPSASLPA